MSVEKTENEISNKNKENFIGDELFILKEKHTAPSLNLLLLAIVR